MKFFIALKLLTLLAVHTASAALMQYSSGTVNLAIPDANFAGVSHSITVNDFSEPIDHVDVRLNIAGGYNGDFYAYLTFESAQPGVNPVLITLLNHPGSPIGYQDHGLNIILNYAAATSIHNYGGNGEANQASPTIWAPDGGNLSGATFSGGNGFGNGTWTLFIADTAGNAVVNEGTLVSWGLDVYGVEAVPEPTTWALILFGALWSLSRMPKWFRALASGPRKQPPTSPDF